MLADQVPYLIFIAAVLLLALLALLWMRMRHKRSQKEEEQKDRYRTIRHAMTCVTTVLVVYLVTTKVGGWVSAVFLVIALLCGLGVWYQRRSSKCSPRIGAGRDTIGSGQGHGRGSHTKRP